MRAFKNGVRIRWNEKTAVIRLFEKDLAVVQFRDGKTVNLPPEQLLTAYNQGEMELVGPELEVKPQPVLTTTQKQQVEVLDAYLQLLHKQEYPGSIATMRAVIAQVNPELEEKYGPTNPMSPATLNRKYRKWLDAGRVTARLLIKPLQARPSRIDDEVKALMDEVIENIYLKNRYINVSQCYRMFASRYQQAGYQPDCPTRNTFEKRIKQRDAYEVTLRREGSVAARRKFRTVLKHFTTEYIMQRVELDAVQPNIELIDAEGNLIGKPVIFLMIDCHSRAILGYSITYGKGETAQAVIECIRHSILPKTREHYPYLQHEWLMYGVPSEIVCDAGAAMTSDSVSAFLASAGISRMTTETRQPWLKPFIERFNRTLRTQCLCYMPGYGGKRSDDFELPATLVQQACMQADEFERVLTGYIVDGYHQDKHSGLNGRSPHWVWNEQVQYNPVMLPENIESLNQFAGVVLEGTIQAHKGLQREKVFYNSRELVSLYRQICQEKNIKNSVKVNFYFNTFDISSIRVIDPFTGELLFVPAIDSRIEQGMTLAEHKRQRSQPADQRIVPESSLADHPDIASATTRQRQRKNERKQRKSRAPARPMMSLTNEERRAMIDSKQQFQPHVQPKHNPDNGISEAVHPNTDLDYDHSDDNDMMEGFSLE